MHWGGGGGLGGLRRGGGLDPGGGTSSFHFFCSDVCLRVMGVGCINEASSSGVLFQGGGVFQIWCMQQG